MEYILDESVIYYMLETFPRKTIPKLYNLFCEKCSNGEIICDKETKKRLESLLEEETSLQWLDENGKMFRNITQKEANILGELVDAGIFEFISRSGAFIRNIPVAMPFIFAIAISDNRTVVMDKKSKDYTIVKHLCNEREIGFMDVDDFLSEISL
ncbi:MAG: DUF4411 family protein [Acetatifactor sp.]|nr:DUF4411 family protein [Acetatifactor sp.]